MAGVGAAHLQESDSDPFGDEGSCSSIPGPGPAGGEQPSLRQLPDDGGAAGGRRQTDEFGDDESVAPIDSRARPVGVPEGSVVLRTLRVDIVPRKLVATYRISTSGFVASQDSADSVEVAHAEVERSLPQLLSCRSQLVDDLKLSLIPAVPPDALATDPQGRDMVMAFVHLLVTNPATAPHPLTRKLLGLADSAQKGSSAFSMRAKDAFGSGATSRKLPAAFTTDLPKVALSPRIDEWGMSDAVLGAFDRLSSCFVRVRQFETLQENARAAAEAWSKLGESALRVREETCLLSDTMRAVAPAIENHGEFMFWPWTRDIVLRGAAHTATRLAIQRTAAKLGPEGNPVPNVPEESLYDHNVNPGCDHPTIRLRRYLDRAANTVLSYADTGVGQATVSAPLYRSMTIVMNERVAESLSAAAAVGQLLNTPGIAALPKRGKELTSLAEQPSPRLTKEQAEESLRSIDAEVSAVWARVRYSVTGFHDQLHTVRRSARKMICSAVDETIKGERALQQASYLVARDLLEMIRSDPFVDDEDRPFADPLAAQDEDSADDADDVEDYGPVSLPPPSNPQLTAPEPEKQAAAAAAATTARDAAPAKPAKTKKHREALRLQEEHDPFHTSAADASPTGREMDEVFRDRQGGIGRPGFAGDGWATRRSQTGTDEFGC